MGRSLDQLTKKKSLSPQSRWLLSAQARRKEVQGKLCGFFPACLCLFLLNTSVLLLPPLLLPCLVIRQHQNPSSSFYQHGPRLEQR